MKKNISYLTTGAFLLAIPGLANAANEWTTVFGDKCATYNCWISKVWAWALVIAVPLSTLMIAGAGFLWMTSQGDPAKIGTAKKIITGVVSGLLFLILARVFIVNIIGLGGDVWNIK